jgi:hypothetical protein
MTDWKWSVRLLGILGLGFVVACGGVGGELDTNQTSVSKPANPLPVDTGKEDASEGGASSISKDEWADASSAVQQGNVRVSIETVGVGKVQLSDLTRSTSSKDDLLQVTVRIENLDDGKKLTYRSWGTKSTEIISQDKAGVEDDLGNSYANVHFGFGTKVVGQAGNASIYPMKSVTDVLVFERPVAKAKSLKISLPAAAFGGTGMLRFRVPIDTIGQSAEQKVSKAKAVKKRPVVKKQESREARESKPVREPAQPTTESKDQRRNAQAAQAAREAKAGRALDLIKQHIAKKRTKTAPFNLKRIVRDYPETQAAKEASELLRRLQKKGK